MLQSPYLCQLSQQQGKGMHEFLIPIGKYGLITLFVLLKMGALKFPGEEGGETKNRHLTNYEAPPHEGEDEVKGGKEG